MAPRGHDPPRNHVAAVAAMLYGAGAKGPDEVEQALYAGAKAQGDQAWSEQYGHGATVYATDPMRPIGTCKEAWEAAKLRAGVACRFHDLRHTGCSRLLDAGVSHPVVAEIMGWSASTAIRMIKDVYGHIGLSAKRQAMELVEQAAEKVLHPQR